MANRTTPYLIRRSDSFSFRIGVPADLRQALHCREIVKSLKTQNREQATPLALALAAQAKQLFTSIRANMAKNNKNTGNETFRTDYATKWVFDDDGKLKSFEVTDATPEDEEAINSHIRTMGMTLAAASPQSTTRKSQISMTWEDCIQKWIEHAKPAQSSINGYRSSVNSFTELFPNVKIEDLGQHHFEDFRVRRKDGYGSRKPAKGTTIQKDESFFVTLLGYAKRAQCIDSIPLDNMAAIKLTEKDEKEVRPYTDEEIQTVFSSPIYTQGHTPLRSGVKEGRGHFWLPLLMLYTGARIEELCQLVAAQIDDHEGIQCLLIYPSRTRIKNGQSRRFVPLHDELLKLGLANHVAQLRKEHGSQAHLFPGLKIKPSTGKIADAFSKWFDRHVVEMGIQKKVTTKLQQEKHLHTCHSLRTTFINKMRSAEGNYREDLEHLIVGHEGKTIHETSYDGAAMVALKRLIDTVQYPGVDLSQHHTMHR